MSASTPSYGLEKWQYRSGWSIAVRRPGKPSYSLPIHFLLANTFT